MSHWLRIAVASRRTSRNRVASQPLPWRWTTLRLRRCISAEGVRRWSAVMLARSTTLISGCATATPHASSAAARYSRQVPQKFLWLEPTMTDLSDSASAFWRVIPADRDPAETREWLDAFESLVRNEGAERATFILRKLLDEARARRVKLPPVFNTPYCNTISLAEQPQYPGNLEIEHRLMALVRWNALAMVVRANREHPELGGHIASYASAADLFEVGYNHFFRAGQQGDLVYFQPHSAPGVYARAFLEGRLSEDELAHYRRETAGQGLTSYCHPYLMPGFWQFPTGSMGLGPITAVYQARFMRYLENRGLLATSARKVWAFVGDGEMDEPEALAGLSIAAREGLDNLIFVVNCNLQRLDGPVRGNGSIIQELEGLFAG